MLHYETVDEGTLGLLKQLQSLDILSEMRLVGGTSLALQIGHRKSIDIDLFGILNVEFDILIDELKTLGEVVLLKNSKNIHSLLINDIKVDIVNYNYKWLTNKMTIDNIYFATIEDIAAMKLNAIMGRGSKKDFIDLYFILKNTKMALFPWYLRVLPILMMPMSRKCHLCSIILPGKQ
ncbi:MAG: nucleotidyl transferase AbiEii/AbiGii toxin family protein [Saprospiraceae bacterium]|nr:nucleotidyl transferase AbiEii/AbiGii toxin family protein [Saprospiraceae bacterium]